MIVYNLEPITLVGGGDVDPKDLKACLAMSDQIVAADAGAAICLAQGVIPDAVIGDLDSIDADALRALPKDRVHQIAEQNSTDFDKALRNISSPLVLGVGFTGGRVDHELACYNALLRHAGRRCVLVGASDIVFLAPPELHLPLEVGTRLSLFPLMSVSGHSTGLRWPIEGLNFAPDGQIGTSNEATGPVTLTWSQAGMLVIVPRDCLEIVAKALVAQPGSWPAL